jgi:hypothetical protein
MSPATFSFFISILGTRFFSTKLFVTWIATLNAAISGAVIPPPLLKIDSTNQIRPNKSQHVIVEKWDATRKGVTNSITAGEKN